MRIIYGLLFVISGESLKNFLMSCLVRVEENAAVAQAMSKANPGVPQEQIQQLRSNVLIGSHYVIE